MPLDGATIRELTERRARESRDTPFCLFGDTALTFGGLDERVNRLAHGLGEAGIHPGDRVAVMLPTHPEHVVTLLALAKLGATHVPVNFHLKGPGLTYVLEHCEARALIADPRYADALAPVLPGLPHLDLIVQRGDGALAGGRKVVRLEELAARGTPHPPREVANAVVAIMYTSGTTGPPKGVMLGDRMYRAAGYAAGLAADVRPGDVVFQWEPYHHIVGVQTFMLCLHYGVTAALVERFTASGFWDQVRRYRATQIHYLGGVLTLLLKQEPRSDDARHTVRIAYGAAAPAALWPEFERRFGVTIREGYGMTEASSFTTVNLAGRVGSIGTPLPYFEVKIVGDDGRPLPPRRMGEIVQRAREPGVIMTGYFKNPEATAATLRDGWLHTGDLGSCDEEGFFYFAGRKKDSVRRRGENVSAWEVERVVNLHPAVEESAVIGVPSPMGEDDIKVFVRPAAGQVVDPLALVRFCEEHLAYFQVPRYVEVIDAFPKTPTERIRKEELSRSVERAWDLEKSGYRLRRAR
jgi:crotonobetaine/carnitine-CoA ligase